MNPEVSRWAALIVKHARTNNLQPALVAGLIATESGGNPDAVSPAGAVGLMQVMPSEQIAGRPTTAALKEPEFNIVYGCALLASMRARHGTQAGMLAAYYGAIDAAGRPTAAHDGSGVDGWGYVARVEGNALDYLAMDGLADEDYRQYAPLSGEWREVADNLKGVCDDALAAGRTMRDRARGVVAAWPAFADTLERWHAELLAGGRQGNDIANKIIDTWGTR